VVWKPGGYGQLTAWLIARCVRTIVVWKRFAPLRSLAANVELRENHSGMETQHRAPVELDKSARLRENHSGMETVSYVNRHFAE